MVPHLSTCAAGSGAALMASATSPVMPPEGTQQADVAAAARGNIPSGTLPGANTGGVNSTILDYARKNLNGDLAKMLNHAVSCDDQKTNFTLSFGHSAR